MLVNFEKFSIFFTCLSNIPSARVSVRPRPWGGGGKLWRPWRGVGPPAAGAPTRACACTGIVLLCSTAVDWQVVHCSTGMSPGISVLHHKLELDLEQSPAQKLRVLAECSGCRPAAKLPIFPSFSLFLRFALAQHSPWLLCPGLQLCHG